MVNEGDLLWTPSAARVEKAHVTAFMRWLESEKNLRFKSYADLWQWSVDDVPAFWGSIWEYFKVRSSSPYTAVLPQTAMPGAQWFPGARLNYAERALSHERPDAIAIAYVSERAPLAHMSWTDLGARVRVLATQLRKLGVVPGDRVVAVLPNIPEAVIGLLATSSIGAVWSCCGPDYGPAGLLDRYGPLTPKVMICVDGYCYGGKSYDRKPQLHQLAAQIPSLQHIIQLPYLDAADRTPLAANVIIWNDLFDHPPISPAEFRFEQVPFDHPLWILFSSGTTGLPKAIVHGHGGIVLEHLKHLHFNFELHPGQRMFFYVTTGWMVWNFLAGSLLSNVVPVLYDGNPVYPNADALWKIIQDSGATLFGTSPAYVAQQQAAGTSPKQSFDLSRLESVTLAGSPVTAQCMQWFYENVKQDLWVASGSGGTDCCTGFVGGVAILPVYAGEIQARALGCAAYAFDESGNVLIDQVGEFVITKPMPSMPVKFWNDPDNRRYLEAYFEQYPGIWRHGDFVLFNARGGSYVLGRSDATLNRHGIRIGTAEVYRTLDRIEEIADSLIVNLDLPGGRFFMPLFVKVRAGHTLEDSLLERIRSRLRSENSPRHVPDKIYAVEAIPYTLTGKKLEVPVRRILMGKDPEKAANRSAVANPDALDYFIAFAKEQRDYSMSS
jgi:acetoacetyl-CoA synthetase